MGPWVAVELLFGEARDLPSEIASLVGFLAVLSLNAARAHRAARLLLIGIANGCVLAGALLFDEKAGGTLPFFALAALPLLLFGPNERRMMVAGVALPFLLFVACQTGAANRLLGIRPLPAPSWWFAANVVSAFAVAFVVPFFFYRSNLRAEASLERMGREKLKRVIDSNLHRRRARQALRVHRGGQRHVPQPARLLAPRAGDGLRRSQDHRAPRPARLHLRPRPRRATEPRHNLGLRADVSPQGRRRRPGAGGRGPARRRRGRGGGVRSRPHRPEERRGPERHAAREPGGPAPARPLQLGRLPRARTPLTACC